MKILIVDAYYPRFLRHALRGIDVGALDYGEMRDKLLQLRFGTADFYSRHLRNLGHEAEDIIVNCEPLQRRWAAEHGLSIGGRWRTVPARVARLPLIRQWFGGSDSLLEIVVRQIRKAKPDVLYMQGLELIPPEILRSLKDSVGIIVGQIASPLPAKEFLRPFDLILTSFPHFVGHFRGMGIASEYFRIGFDPIVLEELGPVARTRVCTFVGGISPAHGARTEFLEQLARALDIEFFGYGADTLPASSSILPKHRGEAWAMDMYRVLTESLITVNVHIDVAQNYANNMRLFEATGCGALLVTDHKDNLHELFRPGIEVISYQSVEEAIEKIRYYSEQRKEASAIAQAGQRRTLREHTYRQRMEELVNVLSRYFRREGK